MAAGCKEKLALLYFIMAAQASSFFQALNIFIRNRRDTASEKVTRKASG